MFGNRRKKERRIKEDALGLVKDFVVEFYCAEFGPSRDLSFLSEETSLEGDLGITERDAEQFMDDFVHEFDLDPADFSMANYFAVGPEETEEEDFAAPVRRFLRRILYGKREYVIVAKEERKKLTLGMLAQALVTGSLSW